MGTSRTAALTVLATVALGAAAVGGTSLAGEPGSTASPSEAASPRAGGPAPTDTDASIERVFQRDCATCHGPSGGGTSRGPSIRDVGTAGVHFVLTTGYMPIDDPKQPMRRDEPAYSAEQIDALVAYVDRFVTGPDVPDVTVDPRLVAHGGEAFRLHCAQCHQFLGVGGVLIGSTSAPTLHLATPTEIVEAIRVGPGAMPGFSEEQLSEEDVDAIASFVELELQEPSDEGGISLGHFGPWTEGLAAWVLGLGGLLVAAAWIGTRT